MKPQPARVIAWQALVVSGLLTASAAAELPPPTSTTATVASSLYATLIDADPRPLRIHVASAGVDIEAFELAAGPHRMTVEYKESRRRPVEGFQPSKAALSSSEAPRPRCAVDFEFQAEKLYRVVRSSIDEDGTLKLFNTDNWGVWLVEDGVDRPAAQCL